MEILNKEEGVFEFKLPGEDIGFANMIVEKLLQDKAVTFASASYDHPLTANPVIKIKGKEPKKSLEKALDAVKKELKQLEDAIKSAR
ncbi:MAG TPA: RpoL/Rpb11 RNA polymerase subunit family protein [Candidatus Norongarragalinales archaeon]|jgi:DNA-directed RNA polymerase subunit L|nr:RpoL/Rpb11 RNA polymerase subunit family protein [Candidatus Norongarragalinales archaeon]